MTNHKETYVTYKSIEEEAADCRAAFAGVEVWAWVWFCHHGIMVEKLSYPAEERIAYILSEKPREEQAIRLREFRPVKDVAAVDDYDAKCAALGADYRVKRAALYADKAKRAALYADYDAKCAALDAELAVIHAREVPDTAWNGKTLFGAL